MNQREHAIFDSLRDTSTDEYFNNKHHHKTYPAELAFSAGFNRGWKAAQAQQPAQATTAQEPVAEWVKHPGLEDYPVLEFKEGYECEIGHKLFLHPAPQRKLTDEQMDDITDAKFGKQSTQVMYHAYREYAKAIIEAAITKEQA